MVATAWTSRSFRALGTTAVVFVTDAWCEGAAVEIVAGVLDDIDRACSRFRADSDLERVNSSPGHPISVGATLLDALDAALHIARWTDGTVDPTIGECLRVLGYVADFAALERRQPPLTRVARVRGWSTVLVDRPRSMVQVPLGVRLDLGATAKAFAADRAASAVHQRLGSGALIGLGGDLAIAGPPPPGGWPVFVTDHHDSEADVDGSPPPGQHIELDYGGLATSSVTVRHWTRGNEPVHHIVDPATGRSAPIVWRTVSAAAASCVEANGASTAAIVMGERALEWLARLGLPARLVRADGTVVVMNGWPEPEAP